MQPILIYVVTFEARDADRVLSALGSIWSDSEGWRETWRLDDRGPGPWRLVVRRACRCVRRLLCRSSQAHKPEGLCFSFAVGGDRLLSMAREGLDGAGIAYEVSQL